MTAQPRPATVSVLLADDQRLLREGLRTLLELHPDLRVVGEAGDGAEAERLVELLRPDVVLMDLRMPRRDGIAATQRIAASWPATRVLVLTTFDDDQLVFRAIAAGACGYLLKDVGSDVLAEAVRAAARGESPLQPSVAGKLLRRLRGETGAAATVLLTGGGDALTARELEVLRLLGTGASNRQIAERLALTEGTVKNYISSILAKTGLHDRTQVALFAVRHGLV
jgi:DNA-binding NarL/FixJ family response regulator